MHRASRPAPPRPIALGVAAGLVAGLAATAHAQYSIQKIIASGETASGGPAPVTDCGAPLIDQYGQTALLVNLSGGNTRHVVRGVSHLSTMLKVGQEAPGRPGATVTAVGDLVGLAPDADMAVSFEVGPASLISLGDPFSWEVVYEEFEAIPGDGYKFIGLPQLSLCAGGGEFAFWYEPTSGAYGTAISPPGQDLVRIIGPGDYVYIVGYLTGLEAMAMHASGEVLAVFTSFDGVSGLLRKARTGGETLVLTTGATVPEGGRFDAEAPMRASWNAGRQVVFSWRTDVINENLDAGVWALMGNGAVSGVMREGYAVPGHPGLAFGEPHAYANEPNLRRSPVIGAGGHVAFVSRLRGSGVTASNDTALFTGLPGEIELIAREGDPSGPGEPAFGDFAASNVSFFVNAHGDLVFFANRVDGGEGIWHRTAHGSGLARVTATGRTLPVNGQSRTIQSVADPARCSGGEDGRGSVFNDSGQFVFSVQFTDNTHAAYRVDAPTLCPADFNDDGVVNTIDFIAFLNAWNAQETDADFNADGAINTIDVIAYLNAFTAGC